MFKKVIYCIINFIGKKIYSDKYVNDTFFEKYKDIGSKWIFEGIKHQKIFGRKNCSAAWPVSRFQTLVNPQNIIFDPEDVYIFQNPGLYIQANGKVKIGKGSYIGPNTGIVSSNHNIYNLDKHDEPKEVIIGRECWIGMNCSVLPGVVLGDRTIVGAGSVVTKSFEEGYCIIAGNPAKVVRTLDKDDFEKEFK